LKQKTTDYDDELIFVITVDSESIVTFACN